LIAALLAQPLVREGKRERAGVQRLVRVLHIVNCHRGKEHRIGGRKGSVFRKPFEGPAQVPELFGFSPWQEPIIQSTPRV